MGEQAFLQVTALSIPSGSGGDKQRGSKVLYRYSKFRASFVPVILGRLLPYYILSGMLQAQFKSTMAFS